MNAIPPSTTTPDVAKAATRTASGATAPRPRAGSAPLAFKYGRNLRPPEHPPERKPAKRGDPLYRPLHIFALDPSQPALEGKVAVVNVPWEELKKGPKGRLFEVELVDPTVQQPVELDLDDAKLLLDRGVRPSTSDGRFHRQMVYAVCSSVYNAFHKALGRDLSWGFDVENLKRDRLLLRPFAREMKNAFYDPVRGELQFGYFTMPYPPRASDTVYTSLSHDIIAHELTHALLDGLRGNFTIPTNPDVLAFHEALGDLVALFHHFSYPEIVRAAIRDSRGNLADHTILSSIAKQFGEGLGKKGSLRTAIDFKDGVPTVMYGSVQEQHALLVAAVFDTFTRVFQRKTARLLRLATGGSGTIAAGALPHELQIALADEASKIATQFLQICIRAIDYCPPVDITFGEFLRAVITADHDLVPDDPWAYRESWVDAFRLRQIYPDGVKHMSEDAILWSAPEKPVAIPELNFARLQFVGDPAHEVSRAEVERQANELAKVIFQRDRLADFGVVAPGDPELGGYTVELPVIESIRSSRRIGPDGQIAFDLVAEVTQQRNVKRDGATFHLFGGSTIIIGPDGEVRYVIRKSVRRKERVEVQAEFIAKASRFWERAGDDWKPTPQPFMLLHEEEPSGHPSSGLRPPSPLDEGRRVDERTR
jgi:hypothetical protein